MNILKPAALYFAVVFGTGFVLGVIRTLFLVPQVGNRTAELIEMPFMLMAIALSARWLNRRFPDPTKLTRLNIGFLALVFLLLAEVGVGVGLRGLSPAASLLNRDPISGTVYYLLLLVFALMPWILTLLQGGRHTETNT